MRQKMTFMILAAVALLVGAGSGSVWAQDALQLTADATQGQPLRVVGFSGFQHLAAYFSRVYFTHLLR